MKNFLKILVLFFFSTTAFAEDKTFSVGKYTNEWLKNKTVMELRTLGFEYTKHGITTTNDSVQYHLYKAINLKENIVVVCFVDTVETICKLP